MHDNAPIYKRNNDQHGLSMCDLEFFAQPGDGVFVVVGGGFFDLRIEILHLILKSDQLAGGRQPEVHINVLSCSHQHKYVGVHCLHSEEMTLINSTWDGERDVHVYAVV